MIIVELCLGLWMVDLPKAPPGLRSGWFNIHKSIGITLGVAILFRVFWRFKHSVPAFPEHMKKWQQKIATATHHLLYLLMLIVPLSGITGSYFSGYPIKYFGFEIARCEFPSPFIKELAAQVHLFSTYALIGLIGFHLLGTLIHIIFFRENILKRLSFWGSTQD